MSKSDFECKFTNKIDKRAYLLEYFVNFGDTTHFPPAGGRPQRQKIDSLHYISNGRKNLKFNIYYGSKRP